MKVSDTGVGAGFALAGAAVFAATLHYPTLDGGHPGPSLFPRILATLMVAFGGALAYQGARARDTGDRVEWAALHRTAGFVNALFVLGGVVAYILVVDRLGFLITGAALLFVLMWRLGVRPLTSLAVALAINGFVHLVFARLLKVPLPVGLLGW